MLVIALKGPKDAFKPYTFKTIVRKTTGKEKTLTELDYVPIEIIDIESLPPEITICSMPIDDILI